MDRDVPLCAALMPQLVERAMKFAVEHGSDTPPAAVKEFLWENFARDHRAADPRRRPHGIAIVGMVGKTVVAHCLVQLVPFAGAFYAEVHQFQKDKRAPDGSRIRVTPAEFATGYGAFLEWARGMNVRDLRIVARNRAVAKVFEKSYGFEGERVVMRKAIWPAETNRGEASVTPIRRIAGRG